MCAVQAMVLSIAGLASKVWFKCSSGGVEIKLSLQRGTVSGYNGYSYMEVDESLCSDLGKGFLGDVPCSAGQAALGLGVTAVLLLAAAAGMGAIIAFKKHLGGMWGGALSLNIVGGVLALASGAGYIGRMADYTNGSEACDTAQAGPILMIISQSMRGEGWYRGKGGGAGWKRKVHRRSCQPSLSSFFL